MATKISYQIGGKYDPKGERAAVKGLQNIQNAAKTFNNALKAIAGAAIFKSINTALDGATEAFNAQNKAVINLNKSLQNNNKIALKDINSINQSLKKLSRNNFFDGDTLNNAAALASNMGLNADQINKVMDAATELTAAGIMPLDQAVKALALSYDGNITTLKKYAPQLENLTKDQLANGEAVKFLKDQYDGYADTMAGTFAGKSTSWENNLSDFKAAIGGIKSVLDTQIKELLTGPLNKITEWIVSNREDIVKFIVNLPTAIYTAVNAITRGLTEAFKPANFESSINKIWDTFTRFCQLAVNIMYDLVAASFNALVDLMRTVGPRMAAALTNSFAADFNNIMYNLVENLANSPLGFLIGKGYELFTGNDWTDVFDKALYKIDDITEGLEDNADYMKEAAQSWQKTSDNIASNFTKTSNQINKEVKTFADDIQTITGIDFNTFWADMVKALGVDLPEEIKAALAGVVITTNGDNTEDDDKGNANANNSNNKKNYLDILNSVGEIGVYIQQLITGQWWNVIIDLVSKIVSAVAENSNNVALLLVMITQLVSTAISSVVPVLDEIAAIILQLFNPINVLLVNILNIVVAVLKAFNFVYSFLADLIDTTVAWLAPLLQAVCVLVEAIGLILLILDPILYVVKYLYKGLMLIVGVLADTIANIIIAIYNGITYIYNAIMDIFNKGNGKKSLKNYNNYNDTANAIMNGINSPALDEALANIANNSNSSASSTSASYTAARDITVNITYSHSYVNGDAEAIALSLWDEIKSAQALGY